MGKRIRKSVAVKDTISLHSEEYPVYSWEIYHSVYKQNIYLVSSNDRSRIQRYIRCQADSPPESIGMIGEYTGASMFSILREGQLILIIALPFIFDGSNLQLSYLVHECLHAVIFMMRNRCIPMPTNGDPHIYDDENLCYHLEWLVKECLDRLTSDKTDKLFLFNQESERSN